MAKATASGAGGVVAEASATVYCQVRMLAACAHPLARAPAPRRCPYARDRTPRPPPPSQGTSAQAEAWSESVAEALRRDPSSGCVFLDRAVARAKAKCEGGVARAAASSKTTSTLLGGCGMLGGGGGGECGLPCHRQAGAGVSDYLG